jgi:HEAT repeats
MMLPTAAGVLLAALASAEPTPSPMPADIPRLIEEIKAAHTSVDWNLTSKFTVIGKPAVPALLEVLTARTSPDGESTRSARCLAAWALSAIGPAAAEAVPTLLEILRDQQENEEVRSTTAAALGAIGVRAQDVVPALLAVFDEPDVKKDDLGFAALGALWRLAKYHPDSRPVLVKALPALRKLQQGQGGSTTFAELFQILEPPSPARRAEEAAIQEVLIRKRIAKDADTWCLGESVSDAAFARLKDLKVTREMHECQAPRSEEPSAPNVIAPLYKELDVRGIDWLSKTRVYAETEACFGFDPCFITEYRMERRGDRWMIVSEETPPAL